jgi:hypothetical protein
MAVSVDSLSFATCPTVVMPRSRSFRGRHLADAPQPFDGQRVQELQLPRWRHDEQTVRLRDAAGDLRQELRARHADGDREPHPLQHRLA